MDDNKEVNWFCKWLIGIFAALCSSILFVTASETNFPFFVYGLSFLGVCVTLTCVFRNRVRVIACSIIALAVLFLGLGYISHEILEDAPFFSGSLTKPSIFNSLLFMVAYGIPSIVYLCKYKFGMQLPKINNHK